MQNRWEFFSSLIRKIFLMTSTKNSKVSYDMKTVEFIPRQPKELVMGRTPFYRVNMNIIFRTSNMFIY